MTGQDAFKGVGEAFAPGTFTYTGHAATLFVGRFLRPVTGEFTYSYQPFEIRGWLTPFVPQEIWTEVT